MVYSTLLNITKELTDVVYTGPVVFPVEYEVWDAPQDYNCSGSPTDSGQFIIGACVNLSLYSGKFTAQPPNGEGVSQSPEGVTERELRRL